MQISRETGIRDMVMKVGLVRRGLLFVGLTGLVNKSCISVYRLVVQSLCVKGHTMAKLLVYGVYTSLYVTLASNNIKPLNFY
jgi:hypothetical protein